MASSGMSATKIYCPDQLEPLPRAFHPKSQCLSESRKLESRGRLIFHEARNACSMLAEPLLFQFFDRKLVNFSINSSHFDVLIKQEFS
jgi:hypothetical protein